MADTEIRVFKTDIGSDGPVARYQIALLVARAIHTPGIMAEDRMVILRKAESQAAASAERYSNNRNVLAAYGDVGIEILKRSKDDSCIDNALKALRDAESRTGDEDIGKTLRTYERRRYEVGL